MNTEARPAVAAPGAAPDIAAGAAVCAAVAIAVLAAAAAAVAAAGLADDARRVLHFGFAGLERTPGEALRIGLHNARLAGGTLLCAIVAPRLPRRGRPCVDLLLATLLAVNAAAAGVALGAYGPRVAASAPHLAAEFAALCLAGGAYLSALRAPLRPRTLAAVAALCALLLAAGAVVETYVQVGGRR